MHSINMLCRMHITVLLFHDSDMNAFNTDTILYYTTTQMLRPILITVVLLLCAHSL